MESLNGIVSSIKILKFSERPLLYFKLDDQSCLIATHSLNFMADVENGMHVVVAGVYNSRKQYVVRKYSVIGDTKMMVEYSHIAM